MNLLPSLGGLGRRGGGGGRGTGVVAVAVREGGKRGTDQGKDKEMLRGGKDRPGSAKSSPKKAVVPVPVAVAVAVGTGAPARAGTGGSPRAPAKAAWQGSEAQGAGTDKGVKTEGVAAAAVPQGAESVVVAGAEVGTRGVGGNERSGSSVAAASGSRSPASGAYDPLSRAWHGERGGAGWGAGAVPVPEGVPVPGRADGQVDGRGAREGLLETWPGAGGGRVAGARGGEKSRGSAETVDFGEWHACGCAE